MSESLKLEKVTLWTSIPTYGDRDTTLSALDYIMQGWDGAIDSECVVLEYDAEELELVKKGHECNECETERETPPTEGIQLKLF